MTNTSLVYDEVDFDPEELSKHLRFAQTLMEAMRDIVLRGEARIEIERKNKLSCY